MRFIRYVIFAAGLVGLLLAAGFVFQMPFTTRLWPWQDGRYSYLFIGSILAAAVAAMLWVGWTGKVGALPAGSLNIFVIAITTSFYFFQLAWQGGHSSLILFGIASLLTTIASGATFLWSRGLPFRDSRPTPTLVRISFGIFIVTLLFAGGALLFRAPIFPWDLNPDSSVIFGCIFIGDAFYFFYGLLRPRWENALGQLLSFLAYDLVLIVPFVALLRAVKPEHWMSLVLYIAILVYSGILAVYYLFIHAPTRFGSRASLVLLIIVCLLISSACTLVTAATPFTDSTSTRIPVEITIGNVTNTVFPTETIIPATPTFIPTVTLAPTNLNPQVLVLAENLPEPDDLVLAPDGSVYISDVTEGTIKAYIPDGQLNLILSGINAPEGMAFLPDGSLVIAEQGKNRLIRYDFQSKTLLPFLDLSNQTGSLGIDGILWNGTNLLVPDSPNGTLLEVSADGKIIRQLASGLKRPTGAWIESTGEILIADENGNAVFRLHPDGALEKVADFSIPDDVIADANGNIFVVTLGDGAVHLLTAGTNQDVVLVSGLNNPQGIIFNTEGNLIVTDSGNHRLLKVLIR